MEIKKTLTTSIALLFSLFLFTSCEGEENSSVQQKTYIVASKRIDCQGVAIQMCFLIKEKNQENWQNFYSSIIGFSYEEGFEYELLVDERNIENPPQDSSSLEYTLINVISKIEKTSDNLPT